MMQKLVQGEHILNKVAEQIIGEGHNVFVVTGQHFVADRDLSFLDGWQITHFIKHGPNVEEQEIMRASMAFHRAQGDVILAIGGGSVIDLCKAIIFPIVTVGEKAPYFVAAPTTVGSGSEATHFAVIYKEKRKTSLVHKHLLPAGVVLDPALTWSLTAYQAAASGMDTLAQAVESYWNVKATAESWRYAADAIGTWKEFFIASVKGDKAARGNMLQAAHLAGKAINITRTTGPHALSYYLTANYSVAHGHAVALFLPVFFLYNLEHATRSELLALLEAKDAMAAKDSIQQYMKEAGLAVTLQELGIDKASILDALLDEVNEERFANNPVPFDRNKLKDLINEYL
jgi:alcohol dehydrogenase